MTTPNRILIESFNHLLHDVQPEDGRPVACDDCTPVLDAFAELVARGVDAPLLAPWIDSHLNECDSCRAQFKELLSEIEASD